MTDGGVVVALSDAPGPSQGLDPLLSPRNGLLEARAVCVAERIDLKSIEAPRLARSPAMFQVGVAGGAVVFRYGAVVFFGATPAEQERFLELISPSLHEPVTRPLQDELADVRLVPSGADVAQDGVVETTALDAQKLQLIADVLAKNVKLADYEIRMEETFSRVEPLAQALERKGRPGRNARKVIRQIGSALLIEHQMVWRMETSEKPELLWDRPDLERLHARLVEEYEIRDRRLALERKLNLLSRTARTVLELWHNQRALRVEWYIVALIVIEIALTLYEMVQS